MSSSPKTIKVCLLGDARVGKTSLVQSWTLHKYSTTEHYDIYGKRINNDCEITFYDVRGDSLMVLNERYSGSTLV